MNEVLEKDFLRRVDSLMNKTNVLYFSTGADAVASYLKLKEHGIKPIMVYHYFIKDLPMVKNYIDYFEKKFDEHIYQFPSTLWTERIDNALYQPPIRARERFRNNIGHYELDKFTKEAFDRLIADTLVEDVVFHLGLRYTDGMRRYQHLMKHGASYGNKFYPIASFQIRDVQNILEKNDCLLPLEYKLWGISFESPRPWNINLIKEHCSETYRQIQKIFPMVGAEGLRKYAALNKHFKQRITQFGKYAMPKEAYKVW
ncbi:MAG: hypothetical protein LBQ88_01685 [Treponema sp.]|jgi:hypothetical protein|nr:hypothetical protein [Treponema sp.]